MKYEFEVIGNITRVVRKKEVNKDVIFKKLFDLDTVAVEEYIDEKGKVLRKYCTIVENTNFFKINHPYNDVVRLIKPVVVQGFHARRESNTIRKSGK